MNKIGFARKITAVTAGLLLALPCSPAFATTLKLDLNGVAGEVYTETSKDEAGNETETGSVTIPEVKIDFGDDYVLTGWNTERNGSGAAYKTGDSVDADTTLYAQWESGFMLLVRDTTNLDELITTAEGIEQGRKSDEAYKTLQDAITTAKNIDNTVNAEQANLDAALAQLKEAITAFDESRGNKLILEALLERAEAIEQGKKSEEQYKALQDAIADAKAVYDNPNSEQADCDEAVEALEAAITTFEDAKGDKTTLEALIAKAKELQQGAKSDEAWSKLQNAIEAAEAIVKDGSAEQADVDEEQKALETAVSDFENSEDVSVLGAALNQGKAIAESAKESLAQTGLRSPYFIGTVLALVFIVGTVVAGMTGVFGGTGRLGIRWNAFKRSFVRH